MTSVNNPHSGSRAAKLSGSQGRRLYHVRLEVVVIAVAVTPLPALKHLLFVLPIHLRVHGNSWISEFVCGGRVEDQESYHISQAVTPNISSRPTSCQKQRKVYVCQGLGIGGRQVQHKNPHLSPGQVAQLVRALSGYAEVAGLISSQGTYKNQPMNALLKWNNKLMFLSPSLKTNKQLTPPTPPQQQQKPLILIVQKQPWLV